MQLCGIVCVNPVPLVFQLPPEAFQKNTDSPEGRRLWSNEQHLHAYSLTACFAQYLIIALNNCLHLSPNRYVLNSLPTVVFRVLRVSVVKCFLALSSPRRHGEHSENLN